MKRSEMLDILEYVLENYMGEKLNHPDVLANVVLEEVEKYMLAPSPYNVPHHDSLYHWEEE